MTPQNASRRRTRHEHDTRHARIAIYLQRMAVDLAAAAREIEKGPEDRQTLNELAILVAIGTRIKKIHNRYSSIKQP